MGAHLELAHKPQGPGAVAALHQGGALLEDELRVVRRGANQALVLGDGLIEVAVRLQQADHTQPQVDLPRADRERAPEGLDGLRAVSRLLVQGPEQGQARKIARMLVLELLDEHRELLVGPVDLRDDLVDLGAKGGLRPRRGERSLQRGERLLVLVSLRLCAAELLERGRERPVVAGGGSDDVLELDLGARELSARVELAAQLAAHEEACRLELEELPVEPLCPLPVLFVEREAHERPEGLLLVRLHGLQGQRALVARAGWRLFAALLVQAGEREDGGRVVALDRDRPLVRRHGVLGPAVDLVEASEGDRRGNLIGARLRRACLEVRDERRDLAVAVAIELHEALERERHPGLGENDARVPGNEGRPAGRLVAAPARWGTRGARSMRRGRCAPVATARIEILPGSRAGGRKDKRDREGPPDPENADAESAHRSSLDAPSVVRDSWSREVESVRLRR